MMAKEQLFSCRSFKPLPPITTDYRMDDCRRFFFLLRMQRFQRHLASLVKIASSSCIKFELALHKKSTEYIFKNASAKAVVGTFALLAFPQI
jgi:hypothetical protein